MIKSLGVSRVGVSVAATSPVEVSNNQQIAINNGVHLTILDPKLPSIQESIISHEGKKILDPKGLFNSTTALSTENMDSSQLNRLGQVSVETMDEPFNFGSISDPMIMRHKWSPLDKSSRDCYLGVLYNTSELLIFERNSSRQSDFRVKINVIEEMMRDLHVEDEQEEIVVSKSKFLSLRVNDFDFVQLEDESGQEKLFLFLATDSGTIKIYCIQNESLELHLEVEIGIPVREISLSDESGKSTRSCHLCVIGEDNAVYLTKVEIANEGRLVTTELREIIPKSRFMISKIAWKGAGDIHILAVASTTKLSIFQVEGTKTKNTQITLKNYDLLVGIIFTSTRSTTTITVAHEDGSFESFKYNLKSNKLTETTSDKELTNFVSKNLYKFHMSKCVSEREVPSDDLKQEDDETISQAQNASTSNELTRPYLNKYIEGDFINYGIVSNVNGIVTIVYRIVPKNILNYTILSKNEFSVGFLRLTGNSDSLKTSNSGSTSLAKINSSWLQTFDQLPPFPFSFTHSEVEDFISNVKKFKLSYLIDINQTNLEIQNFNSISLPQELTNNVTKNITVMELQTLYNFNLIFLNAFRSLSKSSPPLIKDAIQSFTQEQTQIEKTLRIHIYKVVLNFFKNKKQISFDDFDKYLLVNYYLYVNKYEDFSTVKSKLPSDAKINITTPFFTEIFKASVDGIIDDDENISQACSETHHKWSRCGLTFLPLVELSNKTDELKRFNYVGFDKINNNHVTTDIISTLSYCIVTGNRKYHSK